jgi:hypothetical protein
MRQVRQVRVLVTGAGGPGTLNLSRSLLLMTPQPFIVAVDASPYYVHLALGHVRGLVPRASDRQAYLDRIRELCVEHRIDLIIPNNSLEIAVLAEVADALPARVFLPAPPVLETANSKWASYEVWRDAGVPVPETRLIGCPEDLEAAFPELSRGGESPVWVRGAGIPGKGIGVASLPCRTVAQGLEWVRYWDGFGGMIASEYLPGDNLTWMGLFDRGRLVTSQGRKRIAYVIPHVSPSGITGAPAISHTVSDPELNRLGELAVLTLDPAYHGVGFADFKGDAQNRPRVTELNAGRFGTTHFFYSAAGANFPETLVRLAMAWPVDVPLRDALAPDLYWIRTLDAGPVLTTREAIEAGQWPTFGAEGGLWPRVPQNMADFPMMGSPLWPPPADDAPGSR